MFDKKSLRSTLGKLNFLLGLAPKVIRYESSLRGYIPEPYSAVCLLSADFELSWAFRYSKSTNNPGERAAKYASLTRKNLPEIIRLCEEYNIPVTWATVGHLFLKGCNRTNGLAHPEIKRLPYFKNEFWKFSSGDWFDDDPCTDYMTDPAWYCPDLIEQIIKSPVGHEIGCHSFSHIDCRDQVCPDEVFFSEIEACKKAAEPFNVKLQSFVHPGHQIGNLNNLFKAGFTSFRTDFGDTLAYPVKHPSGLWELKNTAEIRYRNNWSVNYHIKRFKTIIGRAIKHKKVCVLWFHPSFDPMIPDLVLPGVFRFIHENKDKIWVTTHKEYVEWLESKL
jgi:hypothetical protein